MVKVGIHESQMKKIAIMTDFFKDFIREAQLENQLDTCEKMLDAYKVMVGEKVKINGEGFDRLRKEQQRQSDECSFQSVDPMHDETKLDSQKL